MAWPSLIRTTAASSPFSTPMSRSASMRCSAGAPGATGAASMWATTCSSSPGGILQAQPPPDAYWVSRKSAEMVMGRTLIGHHLAAGAGTWCHSRKAGPGRAYHAEVSGDDRGSPAAGGDRGIDPGQDGL